MTMEIAREMTFEEEAKFYEKEAIAEFTKETGDGDGGGVNNILRRGMRIIRKARQEIASREVVHGRWVARKICVGSTIFKCSECSRDVEVTNDYFGKPSNHVAKYYPYCHCGAKMDKNENP